MSNGKKACEICIALHCIKRSGVGTAAERGVKVSGGWTQLGSVNGVSGPAKEKEEIRQRAEQDGEAEKKKIS